MVSPWTVQDIVKYYFSQHSPSRMGWGVGAHGLWCQLLEPVGSQHKLLEPVGSLTSSHPGGNSVCSQNQLLEVLSEWREWKAQRWQLEQDCGSQPMCLIPPDGLNVGTFQKLDVPGVCMCIHWWMKICITCKVGALRSGIGCQAGGVSVLVRGGTHKCGVPVEWVFVFPVCMYVGYIHSKKESSSCFPQPGQRPGGSQALNWALGPGLELLEDIP